MSPLSLTSSPFRNINNNNNSSIAKGATSVDSQVYSNLTNDNDNNSYSSSSNTDSFSRANAEEEDHSNLTSEERSVLLLKTTLGGYDEGNTEFDFLTNDGDERNANSSQPVEVDPLSIEMELQLLKECSHYNNFDVQEEDCLTYLNTIEYVGIDKLLL